MMDNFNPKKRYNQFRQARKRKNKFAVPEINTDETSGRHYKLERFLKDCVTYLPMQIIDFEEVETPNEDESAESAAKQKRSKHIKLPLLNECKGIFENVVIGRSARKGENLAAVGATPEDIARLDEDLHALAKVGPDSEMSFEIALPVELQQEQANPPLQGEEIQHGEDQNNRETIQITDKNSEQPQGVTSTMGATEGLPVPDAMDTDFVPNRILEDLNGEPSYANHQSSPDEANVADVSNALFTGKSYDSGFKGSPTISLRKDDDNSDRGSHHCDRHRLNASGRKRSFFDTDSILKSNEAVGRGSGTNEIFSNWRDPPLKGSWLFGSLGGPSNFLESTYPSPGPSFDSEGIRIQSMGRPKEVRANHGGDYCGNRHPLKRRPRQTDLYEEPYRLVDPSITADVLHCFSPINKYRYDRPLSPRQY